MSSFAINGRIVFDPLARLLLLELVAALAIDIRARGGHVSFIDVD